MKARNGFVLLEKKEETNKTKGGVIIPDEISNNKTTRKGFVFVADKEVGLKKGEEVLYNTSGEIEWDIDGEKKYLVHITKIYLSGL